MRRLAALLLVSALAAPFAAAHAPPARAMDVLVFNPLWDAVARGDLQKADRTLGTGTSPDLVDDSGKTPLIYAALANDVDMIALLIRYHVTVDKRDPLGNTALAYAAQKGNVEAAVALLKDGAQIDSQNRQGVTPLMLAASEGRTDMVRFLISKGAAPNKHDFTGRTALDWAAGPHAVQAAALLRQAGAKD